MLAGNKNVPKQQVYYTYHQTPQMFGEYVRHVGELARMEGLTQEVEEVKYDDKDLKKQLKAYQGKTQKILGFLWRNTVCRIGEDWVFLTILAIIMGFTGFTIDRGINLANEARNWLYKDISIENYAARYFAWISLPVVLILFAAAFSSLISPQSVGSGVPEMKTILRGVTLKEYLTFKTLVAKCFGLTASLGAGMPLGKEGPFVHIASIYSVLLSKLVAGFQGIYKNEARATEMLAAACAVGVATCFAAPIGGVLYTLEVTTSYYYVRNYWRAFYAAVWGAMVVRLLAVWCTHAPTLTPMFKTNFAMDFAYDPQELVAYAILGIICGLGAGVYVILHRKYTMFLKTNKFISKFMKDYPFFYPGFVALVVASLMFPPGLGQYMASTLATGQHMQQLFANFTWTSLNLTIAQEQIVGQWTTEHSGIFCHLWIFVAFTYFCSILCLTMPVPCGCFVPIFKTGGAFGRLIGEYMAVWYPSIKKIVPGGYSVAGAAAFSGAVTQSVSTSLVAFELSGEIAHLIPTLVTTIIANAVASLFAPSMYDSVILLKKLPFLPDLLPSNNAMYSIYVEDFMVREVKFVYHKMTYEQLKQLLLENKSMYRFPLVDNSSGKILLGSIQRLQLVGLIERQVGRESRTFEATKRLKDVQERAKQATLKLENAKPKENTEVLVVRSPSNVSIGKKPVKSLSTYTNKYVKKGATNPFLSTNLGASPYSTITASDKHLKISFENYLRSADTEETSQLLRKNRKKIRIIPRRSPSPQNEPLYDMTSEEREAWEEYQLKQPINLSECHVDPAPFQLVERTCLIKVHSMFSMMGLDLAYVTTLGRLVGVVGIKELRKAIEDANNGNLKPRDLQIPLDEEKGNLLKK